MGLGDAHSIVERVAEIGEPVGEILDVIGDEMHDDALALQPSGDTQQPPAHDDAPKALIDLWPDHHIGDAGLILKCQENHARCRAGALAARPGAASMAGRCWIVKIQVDLVASAYL